MKAILVTDFNTILCENQAMGGTSSFSIWSFFLPQIYSSYLKKLKRYLNLFLSLCKIDIF